MTLRGSNQVIFMIHESERAAQPATRKYFLSNHPAEFHLMSHHFTRLRYVSQFF